MCGMRSTRRAGAWMVMLEVTLKAGSPGGITNVEFRALAVKMRSLGGSLATIRAGLTGGRVVHLEDEIGTGFHELGLARRKGHGDESRSEAYEEFGRTG